MAPVKLELRLSITNWGREVHLTGAMEKIIFIKIFCYKSTTKRDMYDNLCTGTIVHEKLNKLVYTLTM